ncbi:NAD-dependent epimerase/dehydratase family protein [Oscillatoria sp. FACHB-1406]|uniref:NAD-dependent epimerase/dehydratase family protein n=1 Tax=Oscillatoria sp. FACHB-1406 TaxID=2692846 RepID=UPI00168523CD|nr:NAD-dependent epimerase/dehydratase family protein [Oscillatoria sp. FACHB-1406]MBD2577191.1 NAD-dependent epimerase/dehydratase family protein [Oscillatoria sp. FACHB-1406]
MSIVITGATGLMGSLFLEALTREQPKAEVHCLVRPDSDRSIINSLALKLYYSVGDSSTPQNWESLLSEKTLNTIIHLAQLRHVPVILDSLKKAQQWPRLIIIGTTGVYSQYNQYSQDYEQAESTLQTYRGSYCLLRPTMIYGSHRDKNLHKLIKFCDRYGFFPVFGSGNCLLQPVHADDLAKALLSVLLNPNIKGSYDLSGGTVVTFRELLALVEKLLEKPVRPLYVPYNLGLGAATFAEKILGARSPVRREQILRLQEDKAYSHEAAQRDFGYEPRSLEIGLAQEIEILRAEGII